jgi:hypothetical protein
MTTSTETRGTAIYLELVRHTTDNAAVEYCEQIIMIPEVSTRSGATIPTTSYVRRLTTIQPRKQWKTMTSAPIDVIGTPSSSDKAEIAHRSLSGVRHRVERAQNSFGAKHRAPIFVEITDEDLESVRSGKTPYKILGRINKCRKANGLSKDLVGPSAVAGNAWVNKPWSYSD